MLRILKYVTRQKIRVTIAVVLMITCIVLNLLVPYFIMNLVDEGIMLLDTSVVIYYAALILIVIGTIAIIGYIRNVLFVGIGVRVHQDLKHEVFEHVQTLDTQYFDTTSTGELLSRADSDIENIWATLDFGVKTAIENIVIFIGTSILMFSINPQLTLLLLFILLPVGFLVRSLSKRLGEEYGEISDHVARINTRAQQNIAGVRLVKAFAREKYEVFNFLRVNNDYYDLNMKVAKTYRTHYPIIEFLTNMSLVALIIFGGYFILEGKMTLGELVAFSGYIWNLINPMRNIGWLTDMFSKSQASGKKIFAILDYKAKIENRFDPLVTDAIVGSVEFKNVSFSYNGEKVLSDINVSIPAGSRVAIMGATGAGKSSLISLLSRSYEVDEGCVQVDGVDVRDYDLTSLRKAISLVAQESFLFSDSLENNIKLSNPNATEWEMREACRIACALEFIDVMDEGFKTEVGERGLGLSGGQKQRVSIARSLLKSSPILILDDSTSALDMETEHTLLENLSKDNRKRTTFLIAHRISAVKSADMILFMENGKITEIGRHEELIAKKGKYYCIYKEQYKDLGAVESGA